MKKIVYTLVVGSLLIAASCSREPLNSITSQEQEPQTPLSSAEIAKQIDDSFKNKGSFDWKEGSDALIWSAALEGQNILAVGYGTESFRNQPSDLNQTKQSILNLIAELEGKKVEELLVYDDAVLNYFDVQITQYQTVKKLRQLNSIRYVEPTGYSLPQSGPKSDSGCSTGGETIASADYGTLSTGAKIPWNYYTHKINQAWAYSTGRGVTVAVIDTGVSDNQILFGSEFDDYYSGRSIQKYAAYVDSWNPWSNTTDGYHDKCGHGTSASSAIASPNNKRGAPVGVAYECNLITYRGTSDVVLDGYQEQRGVTRSLTELGNKSQVKIISMSIGYPWSIGNISDAVIYAYSKGKMIFAAGGTSTEYTNWYPVIFPASMAETVAVTGVEEGSAYTECDVCHWGSQIDFTYVMERGNNNHQPVAGYYTGQNSYFGGSSVATASTAGIAALVWAKYPTWTRAQVLARLKFAGSAYPNETADFGYGNIDALKAVRGY
jgi:serine protease